MRIIFLCKESRLHEEHIYIVYNLNEAINEMFKLIDQTIYFDLLEQPYRCKYILCHGKN